MIDNLIETIQNFLLRVFVHPEIVTVLIAILPIVEARMAIPIGLEYGLGYFKSWALAFVGSSLMAPLLLLVLIPLIRWLASTRLFKKIGSALYDKFEKRSRTVGGADEVEDNGSGEGVRGEVSAASGEVSAASGEVSAASGEVSAASGKPKRRWRLSAENKKMLGVFLFVAIPLPLTGVWTGCAVASILKIRYWKGLVGVVAGNLVASAIILLICRFFEAYTSIIIAVLGAIAAVIVVVLIIKIILHKPSESRDQTPGGRE